MNGLIYRLTVRMLLRGKRPIGLAILPLLAVLLAIADRAMRTSNRFGGTALIPANPNTRR